MNHKQCPFCKTVGRLAVFSVFRQAPKARVQCLVCRAAGPEGDNPDDAWTRWRWVLDDPEIECLPTTAAEVAKDTLSAETCFDVLLKRLDAFHPRLNRQDADLGEIQGRVESIDRRLGDMQTSLDRIVTAGETPKSPSLPRGKQARGQADKWLANHPRILELTREVRRIRKLESEIQTLKKRLGPL